MSRSGAILGITGMRMVRTTAQNHVSREHNSDKYAKKTGHEFPRLRLHNRQYNLTILTLTHPPPLIGDECYDSLYV
jgi:hypothetical protein